MGKDTAIIMQDANRTLYKDRDGLIRMIRNQEDMGRDIE